MSKIEIECIRDNKGRFIKGQTSWNKGIPISEKQKRILSKANKGRIPKTIFKKGSAPWNTGKKFSKELCEKLSKSHIGLTKEKSSNWKGGITLEHRLVRTSLEYKLWRIAVFTRDEYTCKKCNKRGNTIHAHHLWPFSKFPELRFAINNGITLCKQCHKEIHYGKKY
jgi:hypothetical protein